MTDLLRERLHTQGAEIDVPLPPTDAVLRSGKRRRTRRRALALSGGVAATVMVVGAVTVAQPWGIGQNRSIEPAQDTSSDNLYRQVGAFASGSTVYVGTASADVDKKIKGIYDTSIGAVVKTGSTYTVVNADGDTRKVASIEDVVVGTDPTQPHLGYTEPDGSGFDMVVIDVRDGSEVARAKVDRPFTWGGWNGPPSVLSGDLMWSHFDDGWVELDLRDGSTRIVPGTATNVYETAGGLYAEQHRREWVVRRMADGSLVRRFDASRNTYAFFSPDGQYLKFWDQESEDGAPWDIRDVASGRPVVLSEGIKPWDVQWAPNGSLTYLDAEQGIVQSCDPATGACVPVDLSFLPGDIWRAGTTAED